MTWRDRGSRALKHAAMNEGASAAAPGPVTAYYSSPGGAGDYAEADSVVAARVVFPGAAAPVCTVLAWSRNGGNIFLKTAGSASETLVAYDSGSPGLACGMVDTPGVVNIEAYGSGSSPAAATWGHHGYVCDGANLLAYAAGASDGGVSLAGGTWSAADVFMALVANCAGDIRNILIIDRALSANEIADLYAAGPTHHPLRATGTHWAAGQSIPVIWCTPAVGGVVANSGDGGACGLVLHGDVASLLDP